MPFPFDIVRGVLLALVFGCHSALIALAAVAFATRSRSVPIAFQLAMDCVAIIIIAAFLIYKSSHGRSEPGNTTGMVTFGSLWLTGLTGSIPVTLHAHDHHGASLVEDFMGVAYYDAVALIFVGLSWIAAVAAVIGLVICYVDDLPGVIKVRPRKYPRLRTPESKLPGAKIKLKHSLPFESQYAEWSNVDLGV